VSIFQIVTNKETDTDTDVFLRITRVTGARDDYGCQFETDMGSPKE
jgi:hypothetical protein